MEEPASANPAVTCPRCGTPVRPNTQFCDHCGARVTSPPACTLCGTMLEPNSRFCPSCGTMIGASPDQQRDKKGESGQHPELSPDNPDVLPDPQMMIPGAETSGLPEEKAGSETPAPVLKFPKKPKRALITIPPGTRSRLHPKEIWVHYGGVILIILALIMILAGISTLVSSGLFGHADSSGTALPIITPSVTVGQVTPSPTVTATVNPVETVGNVSFVPGPVEQPSENLRITLQVERDPRSFIVSVMYMGGKGQYGVRDIFVRLTRSDGTVLEETFRPVQIGSHVDLQGTQKTDRVEVIVRYHTGAEYKVIDQVFEYKIRT